MFDVEMIEEQSTRVHMKRLAIDTCISFLGRTISQSKFKVKNGQEYEENDLFYRLNIRPNKNMTATTFWETFINKLVYDNECLIIQSDDEDLLIADDFQKSEYAIFEDVFTNVTVKGYTFKRSFKQSEVIHLRYKNDKLSPLIEGLFTDYGELFGRILSAQKRKNQIRGTVDMDMMTAKSEKHQAKLQEFIDNMYKAVGTKDVAIIPQQPGFKYSEVAANSGNGQTVEEINKVTNGFLNQIAMAIGIPTSLLFGDMADVEKQTKNYMNFTVNPLLKKIGDEANVKFFEKSEFLEGKKIEIQAMSYQSLFDLAPSIDKAVSSGVYTPNEIRVKMGEQKSEDPNMDKHYITKNYAEVNDKGGDNNNENEAI